MTDLEATRRAIIPGKTKLVMVESPTNPRMQVRCRAYITTMH
jgi:cystathionine beta-lyase